MLITALRSTILVVLVCLGVMLPARLDAASRTNVTTYYARHTDVSGAQAAATQPPVRATIRYRLVSWEGLPTSARTRDGLLVFAQPSLRSHHIGTLPLNATPIRIVDAGASVQDPQVAWVRIQYGNLVGWTDGRPIRPCDVYLGATLAFTTFEEGRGCAEIVEIAYAPTNKHFLIVVHGFEAENDLYLMRADGQGLRKITDRADYLSLNNYAWAADGHSVLYKRSTEDPTADPLPPAPPGRGVRYELHSAEKTTGGFRVTNVGRGNVLHIRARPGAQSSIVGRIPSTGTNVTYLGGPGVQVGAAVWWRIRYGSVTGYVHSAFLRCGVAVDVVRWREGLC